MASIKELAVSMTRQAAEGLERNLHAMPEDKVLWQPFDAGRTAVNQLAECGGANLFFSRILRERALEQMDPAGRQRFIEEHDTPEKALDALKSGTAQLVEAIEAFPEEHLDDKIRFPWGMERTFAEAMFIPCSNMTWHLGQIAYIQTLYGDKEMH